MTCKPDWFYDEWSSKKYKIGVKLMLGLGVPIVFAFNVYLGYYIKNFVLKLEVK
jgi:hypothetical protein